MRTALITGITGQDGRHLAEFLIEKEYQVYGLVNGQRRDRAEILSIELPKVQQIYGDLRDNSSIITAIQQTHPDEIYNLGAISFVGLSFSQPELTADVTGLGLLRIMEACRTLGIDQNVRIYQASSSEMFGKVRQSPQTEETPFHPRSPYGIAKTFAHYSGVNYREAYDMFISNGILFNHEGEYRGYEFVTRKITQGVARIKLGMSKEISLGSLDPHRDWGYAGDYVEAMWLMLQHSHGDDFVIATGKTHSVKEFLISAFESAGIEDGISRYVKQDSRFLRPSEVEYLRGDFSKAKKEIGWSPKTDFVDLVRLMIRNDLIIESRKAGISVPKSPVT